MLKEHIDIMGPEAKLSDGEQKANVVFCKIYSNQGVMNTLHRQCERNDGVYDGPDAVLNVDFLRNFPATKLIDFKFSENSTLEGRDFYRIVAEESLLCADYILSRTVATDTLVAVGGDNSIVFPVLLSDFSRFGTKSFGVITFDTHGDIHLHSDSPTGNFHGTYMRPFFDSFDISEIDRLVPNKLDGKDIVYFGNFDFEREEIDFMNIKNIRRFSSNDIRGDFEKVKMFLLNYLDMHDHIFINFDIDIFDETLVRATGIRNAHGLLIDDVFPLLKIINNHKSKTISLSEVNPDKEGIGGTVRVAQDVITALVS